MKEFAPNEDAPIPQNISLVNIGGEMVPDIDSSSARAERYINTENGMGFFKVSKDPKKQFVASQLIGTVVPMAPLVEANLESGEPAFFSLDSEEHIEHNGTRYSIQDILNRWFILSIFGDDDHAPGHNVKGSIFYDFEYAQFEEGTDKISLPMRQLIVEKMFQGMDKKVISEFRSKITQFQQAISGEEGLAFITALLHKADYHELAPEVLQQNLLDRCEETLRAVPEQTK